MNQQILFLSLFDLHQFCCLHMLIQRYQLHLYYYSYFINFSATILNMVCADSNKQFYFSYHKHQSSTNILITSIIDIGRNKSSFQSLVCVFASACLLNHVMIKLHECIDFTLSNYTLLFTHNHNQIGFMQTYFLP